jgi:hypothetical protein
MRIHRGYLCLCAGLVAGCENPHPSLTAVSPNQAYSGADVNLALFGDNLLPATILDPDQGRRIATSDGFQIRIGNGTEWSQLGDVAWLSPSRMTAWFTSAMANGFAPGPLDIELVDPRGEKATLPGGFALLGRDESPPILLFDGPDEDAMFAPGMLLRGRFHAADVPPGKLTRLDWTYYENNDPVDGSAGSCLVPPESTEAGCSFQVQISDGLHEGDVVRIVALAYDEASPPNQGDSQRAFVLRPVPSVSAIAPPSGGTAGGTDVVITGRGFVPGSKATLDGVLLFPDGGLYVDPNTLSGHVPPHKAGVAALVVHTPLGDTTDAVVFQYLAPPQILAIDPKVEGISGATQVKITGKNFSQQTRIYFGTALESALPLVQPTWQADTLIVGFAPAGHGQATVWAFDADLGFTALVDAFAWRTP